MRELVIMITIIKKLCQEKGTNIRKVEDACNLANGSIRRWDDSYPSADRLLAVAQYFGVSLEYLLGVEKPAAPADALAADLAKLDEHGRELVRAIVNVELGRKEKPVIETPKKVIPLFPAAAGPGEPIDGEPLDDYEVDADSPAQFAVRISGDSMEPELKDGEIVLCKRKRPEVGELAVISVNGSMLVKQYITDGANIYLRSLNRDRKELDVDIWSTGNDTVIGYGTVIHNKVALVKQ